MSRLYGIGDIHGQLDQLKRALDWIAADQAREGGPEAPVVFVGDLTDRGPDSKGVIDHMLNCLDDGCNWIVIKGNHDRLFTQFLADPTWHDPTLRAGLTWLSPGLGGMTTLASYGITRRLIEGRTGLHQRFLEAVPERHRRFLEDRPLMHREGDYVFVHAGLRPGVAIDAQDEEDLLWIRSEWLEDTRDHGPLVIHGHTPGPAPEHFGNRVNLDGGAAFGRDLVPVVFEGRSAWSLGKNGRTPMQPIG